MRDLNEIQSEQIEKVLSVVAEFYECSVEELVSNDRKSTVMKARRLAMYMLSQYPGMYIIDIAKIFGKRDHGIVVHSISAVKEQIAKDRDYRMVVNYLWLKFIKAA